MRMPLQRVAASCSCCILFFFTHFPFFKHIFWTKKKTDLQLLRAFKINKALISLIRLSLSLYLGSNKALSLYLCSVGRELQLLRAFKLQRGPVADRCVTSRVTYREP